LTTANRTTELTCTAAGLDAGYRLDGDDIATGSLCCGGLRPTKLCIARAVADKDGSGRPEWRGFVGSRLLSLT
jgi:hypothetical protein